LNFCLQFLDFDLETPNDWLDVRNGRTDSSASFGRFSGSQLPKVIMSAGGSLFVRLRTNSSGSRRGFNATFSTGT
jgi:hypothetical protein